VHVIYIYGAAQNVPRQKLQFLITRWMFYYEILYDYSPGLNALGLGLLLRILHVYNFVNLYRKHPASYEKLQFLSGDVLSRTVYIDNMH